MTSVSHRFTLVHRVAHLRLKVITLDVEACTLTSLHISIQLSLLSSKVDRIWKQPFSGATLLYALNRYASVVELLVVIVAFNLPAWAENVSGEFDIWLHILCFGNSFT